MIGPDTALPRTPCYHLGTNVHDWFPVKAVWRVASRHTETPDAVTAPSARLRHQFALVGGVSARTLNKCCFLASDWLLSDQERSLVKV